MGKFLLAGALFLLLQSSGPSYKNQIEHWQRERLAALTADDGWLTVAGLFWLKEGRNTIGAGAGNQILLPKGSAPAMLGAFEFHNGATSFEAAPGADVSVNGKPAVSSPLRSDVSGNPDVIRVRDLAMYVIRRGKRFGIRLKDKNSKMRREFAGLKYFPIDERYRLTGKFVAYGPSKKIKVPDILGDIADEPCPGYAEFSLNGQTLRLEPIVEDGLLFFIFKDQTSGKETYPAGRFLYAEMPHDGEVILDFNKAYNPPCAFTPFATCPLPPSQNHLPLRIQAGELRYGH